MIALLAGAAFVFGQDTVRTAPKTTRKSKPAPSAKASSVFQNDSVKVIIDEGGVSIQKPSGEIKRIPLPPDDAELEILKNEARVRRMELRALQREKSGFVLGDSVFLEELPEEKSYRARVLSGDRIAFGRTLRVEENEELNGDVVAVFGRANIEGKVNGDVVAPFGTVFLGPHAEVQGDVIAGSLEKFDGAVVHGSLVTVGFGNRGARIFRGHPLDFYEEGPFSNPPVFLIVTLLTTGVLLLIYILTWALVPQRVETVRNQVSEGFLKSFIIGFLGLLAILPVFVLLLVTIIGIPVALIVLPLAIIVATFLGDTSVSLAVGERLKKTLNFSTDSKIFLIAAGLFILEFPFLTGALLMIMGDAAVGLGIFLFVFGCLLNLVLWMVGFGAVILTRYGGRSKIAPAAPSASVPTLTPQPSAPPAGA